MSSTSSSSLPSLTLSNPNPHRQPRSAGRERNAKNLSISTKPSWPSLQINPNPPNISAERKRSNSVSLLLPYYTTTHQDDEPPDPPYPEGPIEILPRVWLGHEGHARDVKLLKERGIGWVLNVAKEVDLELGEGWVVHEPPPEPEREREEQDVDMDCGGKQSHLKYLKLPWSHGQQDLCEVGFAAAMRFVDQALAQGDGVLVHCQCGVSRSATLVMALVIRAGHQARICGDAEHPLCSIASHNDAYEYVQGKSRWVGPNIVLINQLVEYSKGLRSLASSSAMAVDAPSKPLPAPTVSVSVPCSEQDDRRSRTLSQSTDLSQTADDRLFSSSDSSASSSPGLASPPTPENYRSPEIGPESIEAMLLDKQMEVQYEKLCQQRAAAAAAASRAQGQQYPSTEHMHTPARTLGLGISSPAPLSSPISPLSSGGGRPSRVRAASAESALATKAPWNIGKLLRVDEES